MTVQLVTLTVAAGALACWALNAWLDRRYGRQVHPDPSITVGLALIAGWALIAFATATLVLIEVFA